MLTGALFLDFCVYKGAIIDVPSQRLDFEDFGMLSDLEGVVNMHINVILCPSNSVVHLTLYRT